MRKYFSFIFIAIIFFVSCSKQNQLLNTKPLTDYFPLQTGKYITYNLDSTVYINFGKKDTIKSYQVKDSIDAQITDNLGRPAFRIFRFIRKNALQAWQSNNTFLAVPTDRTIEFIENNLRFIKLVQPIEEDYTWKGNGYLTSNPYPSYNFSSAFTDDWDYTYQQVDSSQVIGAYNLNNVLTVFQRDESLGNVALPGTLYAERTYSIEKYAKNIGLVYKQFLHWEYQGNTMSYTGFGVKLTMIDHN